MEAVALKVTEDKRGYCGSSEVQVKETAQQNSMSNDEFSIQLVQPDCPILQ